MGQQRGAFITEQEQPLIVPHLCLHDESADFKLCDMWFLVGKHYILFPFSVRLFVITCNFKFLPSFQRACEREGTPTETNTGVKSNRRSVRRFPVTQN